MTLPQSLHGDRDELRLEAMGEHLRHYLAQDRQWPLRVELVRGVRHEGCELSCQKQGVMQGECGRVVRQKE